MWSDLDTSEEKPDVKGPGKFKRIFTNFPGVFFLVFGIAAVIVLGVLVWGFVNPPDPAGHTHEKLYYMWDGGIFLAIRNSDTITWQDIQVSISYEESPVVFSSSIKSLEPDKLTSLRYSSFKDSNGYVFSRDQCGYVEATIIATTPTGEEIKLTGELWPDRME